MTAEPDSLDRYSCDEVLRRLDDYVDRALTESELRRVDDHLAGCLACASAARFERSLLDGIRVRLQRLAIPAELRTAIHIRLMSETLYQADGPGPPTGGL
jgi:anti-sigma factor (TIGR02949 family)